MRAIIFVISLILSSFGSRPTPAFCSSPCPSRKKISRQNKAFNTIQRIRNDGSIQSTFLAMNDSSENTETTESPFKFSLSTVAILAGVLGVALHGQAWVHFFSSLAQMKANGTPEDFSAGLNFWLFGALVHPILQPAFWISEVLHGSPGPKLLDLIPVTFLFGTSAIAYLIITREELGKAASIATLAALLSYVGAGLDGQAGLGDYNIQLDDAYQGKVVKGCPAYETLRQPGTEKFNLEKYQGAWYWQKVHDWTQFKEVYDTRLDISLIGDGGYRNQLNIKGPSPKTSPLSWDKSPLANGASYFWTGKVGDTPGITQETGFGVGFPNYIVGIDFMSRSPEMSNAELDQMHERAEKAGLFPYGASPEQMIRIGRRPATGSSVVNNKWQALWRTLGTDQFLEKTSDSID